MKKNYLCAAALLASTLLPAFADNSARQQYSIYVDEKGVLRRSDTKREVAYYGTNYTAPFAHAYRALGYLGVDRKTAIKRDVYHMARLGFNAFRLHLWDVELSDAQGNLQANEHLDLLDFMIAELEKRGIDIVLTAQTNFGNGYPERNIDTGAFSYDFEKCNIHENTEAQRIQENYLRQLASHVNPYTGLSYGSDKAIVAMEINNEPCHSGTAGEVTDYINRMAKALRHSGFNKPILYNVTHNPDVTGAYYKADIQGTTYQWYPTGLVAGKERQGNFLPHVDEYPIPWADTMPGYADKARFIYEFDPGDVLSANLYPAIVRTLRGKGFQWITQFAYDPTDLARYNTEYQTHYLNLAYTPAKALSMLIAAQAMQELPRGKSYGSYPDNTVFGHTSLSTEGKGNSLYNSPTKFYHTSSTYVAPVKPSSLEHLAGVKDNPLVSYTGSGAWFIDKLDKNHWRLEVMPDVVLTRDPFCKPSLSRETGEIIYSTHPMTIKLPALKDDFLYTPLNEGNTHSGKAQGHTMDVKPGVYLLSNGTPDTDKWTSGTPFGAETAAFKRDNMLLGEYAAPDASENPKPFLVHNPRTLADIGSDMKISCEAYSPMPVDSIVLYPSTASFWSASNELYAMGRQTTGSPEKWTLNLRDRKEGPFSYRIVLWSDGKATTFPGGYAGTPLDWDFPDDAPLYTTINTDGRHKYQLLDINTGNPEARVFPQAEGGWLRKQYIPDVGFEVYMLEFTPETADTEAVVQVNADVENDAFCTDSHEHNALEISFPSLPRNVGRIQAGFTDRNGVTYTHSFTPSEMKEDAGFSISIPFSEMKPQPYTRLLPAAYPIITAVKFTPVKVKTELSPAEIENMVLIFSDVKAGEKVSVTLGKASLTNLP